MIILDKFSENCNIVSPKECVPKKIKDISVKVFDEMKNRNEAKVMIKHISCD